jgi:hypothetical protein
MTALLTSLGEEKTQMHDHPSHFKAKPKCMTTLLTSKLEFHREKKKPKCMIALLTSPGEEKPLMHDRPSHFTGRRKNPKCMTPPSHFTGRRKKPKCPTLLLISLGEEKKSTCMTTLLISPREERTQMGDHPSLLVPHTNLKYIFVWACVKSQDY